MFGLFSRPTRRPRHIRRTPVRPALRVEALEARANPDANPTLSNVAAVWTSPTQVVITGTVIDASASAMPSSTDTSGAAAPAVVIVGGGASPTTTTTNAQGNFTVTANVAPGGTVLVAAQPITATAPTPVTVVAAGQPTLSNVTITEEGGAWHIRGQVAGGDPIGLIITIISQDPTTNGQTNVVENPDGSFDITIQPTISGDISITLGDGDGNIFDQHDFGFID